MISSEKKILFFHIPKTAGSSIYNSLRLSCLDCHNLHRNLTSHYIKNKKLLKKFSIDFHIDQLSLKEILDTAALSVHNYFEFTIVRNPYDRLLSQYNFDARPVSTRKYLDFDSFLDLCEDPDYVNPTTPFWYKSQLSWIRNPLSKNFKYYKYEELDKAWIDIREKTSIDLPNLPLINKNNVSKLAELKQSYKDRIYNMFRDEFDLLNYEK